MPQKSFLQGLLPAHRHASSRQPHDVSEIEVINPNFSRRLSGVTSTLERIVTIQAKSMKSVAVGFGLHASVPHVRIRDLLSFRKSRNGRQRIWHARRNIEMLWGVILRDLFGFELRLVFTSASQRQHTVWTRRLIDRMDGLIATSNASASYLEHPSTVIGHGIDLDRFYPAVDIRVEREALGLPQLRFVGCFGRIRHRKGTDTFVEAMLKVLPSRPDVGAIILGRTTRAHRHYFRTLNERVRDAHLSDRLLFLPEVSTFEIAKWYRALDVLAAPQRWEGFGVTPLEAMASGVPVVATTVGAFPQLVTDDVGRLVAPGDADALALAIGEILDHPNVGAEKRAAARARAEEKFSINIEADEVIKFYRTLTGQTRNITNEHPLMAKELNHSS
nr:glycosyltransferase family 4 protein [Hyphomicrobium denitrificans]